MFKQQTEHLHSLLMAKRDQKNITAK